MIGVANHVQGWISVIDITGVTNTFSLDLLLNQQEDTYSWHQY